MFATALKKNSPVRNAQNNEHHLKDREAVFTGIASAIPLMIKLGWVYLGFKRRSKKAGKIFKKELIANGIDKKMAEVMTEEYLKTSHFLNEFDFSYVLNMRK